MSNDKNNVHVIRSSLINLKSVSITAFNTNTNIVFGLLFYFQVDLSTQESKICTNCTCKNHLYFLIKYLTNHPVLFELSRNNQKV